MLADLGRQLRVAAVGLRVMRTDLDRPGSQLGLAADSPPGAWAELTAGRSASCLTTGRAEVMGAARSSPPAADRICFAAGAEVAALIIATSLAASAEAEAEVAAEQGETAVQASSESR